MRMRTIYITLAGSLMSAGVAIGAGPVLGADEACYIRAEDGACLDEPALPRTGQYNGADDHVDAPPVGIDVGNQPHGAVRLREATFIDAHDICRYVDNASTRGPGLFVGLKSRQEWAAFALEGGNPPGSTVTRCCRPIAVEICGQNKSIPYTRLGEAVTLTGGHDREVTYTCAAATDGVAPTHDTSWLVDEAGQCQQPGSCIPGTRGCCPPGQRWQGPAREPGRCVPIGGGDGGSHGGGQGNDGPDGPAHDGHNGGAGSGGQGPG